MMAEFLKVLISSTVRDLPDHRWEAEKACLSQDFHPSMMDYLPASAQEAETVSLNMVDEADVYLGIFAHRYGHIPPGAEISITEMEYRHAVKRGIPRLIFLMHPDHPLKAADFELGFAAEKLKDFKSRLKSENIVNYFKSPDDLRALIVNSLAWLHRDMGNGPQGAQSTPAVRGGPYRRQMVRRSEGGGSPRGSLRLSPIPTTGAVSPGAHFISYSRKDAADFAQQLYDRLLVGPPPFQVWLDRRNIRPGQDGSRVADEAIRLCSSLLFVMTRDSVSDFSRCRNEYLHALEYKKPIIPLILDPQAELPLELGNRQAIDFSAGFNSGMDKLRSHLLWLGSGEGILRTLEDRLEDARQEFGHAKNEHQRVRIQEEMALLEEQIGAQRRLVKDPQGEERRARKRIQKQIDREKQPESQVPSQTPGRLVNQPPFDVPGYYQDRLPESRSVLAFLRDSSLRLLWVHGPGGVGKTALVLKVLKQIEKGKLPGRGKQVPVDRIVFFNNYDSSRVSFLQFYYDLSRLLPEGLAGQPRVDPQAGARKMMQNLLPRFSSGLIVVLLDRLDELINPETGKLSDKELDQALHALLELPQHPVKVILTTRVILRDIRLFQPGRQADIFLEQGLELRYTRKILLRLDGDGRAGLRDAPDEVMQQVHRISRGYPELLEAICASLATGGADPLADFLADGEDLPHERLSRLLVVEAFSRLDPFAQQVVQALAIYASPVSAAAVDFLLQPYLPAVNSAPVLKRLFNMQRINKEGNRYYLPEKDRLYALSRIRKTAGPERAAGDAPLFIQPALYRRAAEYFRRIQTPEESWSEIGDLRPQLLEFEMLYAAQDYDGAAGTLSSINRYLYDWGHYQEILRLHARLEDKVSDPEAKLKSLSIIGSANAALGQVQNAIAAQEQALALARQQKNREGESGFLSNLGNRYLELGQTARAARYYKQALDISIEMEDLAGQARSLSNLANSYAGLGEFDRAVEYYQKAIVLARAQNQLQSQGIAMARLSELLAYEGQYDKASRYARDSLKIGEKTNIPRIRGAARYSLALAGLFSGRLHAALEWIQAARLDDDPQNNANILALHGVIALRLGYKEEAVEAFTAADSAAASLLKENSQNYDAGDSRGLALSGLVLCTEDPEERQRRLDAAVQVYREARRSNRDPGVVGRCLQLLYALSLAHTEGWRLLPKAAAAADGKV